jgi:hypothetical protein
MEQPGGQTAPSRFAKFMTTPWILWIFTAIGVYAIVSWGSRFKGDTWEFWFSAGGLAVFVASILFTTRRLQRPADDEAQARQRVREAEDKLSDALRRSNSIVTVRGHWRNGAWVAPHKRVVVSPSDGRGDEAEADEDIPAEADEAKDERLTLAALWDVTHKRMGYYHTIVTGQAKRSFIAAQAAMGIGFVLLVVFAVLAAEAKTTTAAISAGGLGAVSAALSGYISKTLIRSQESAAGHLRAYFDQPLELSRYLAAERLLADAKELTPDQRAAILTSLVQSIATAGQPDDTTRDGRPTGRQRLQ